MRVFIWHAIISGGIWYFPVVPMCSLTPDTDMWKYGTLVNVTGSFSKRRYWCKCSGYPVAVNTTIMCKKNAFNNGEIISTENHVTLIMQLGCNLVMSIICNVVPAVRYLLVDHDWKLDPVTDDVSILTYAMTLKVMPFICCVLFVLLFFPRLCCETIDVLLAPRTDPAQFNVLNERARPK